MTRLAYFFLVHKAPQQIERTFRAVHAPSNLYVFHADRKAPAPVHAAVDRIARRHANCHILPAEAVYWCGYSTVRTTLTGIRGALALGEWDFLINLSAQDFPLLSQPEIAARLAPHQGRSLLETFDMARERPWYLKRYTRFTLELMGRSRVVPRIPRRVSLQGLTLYAGSQWWILSRAACEYFARWSDPLLHRLDRLYRYSWCPDESFFQTALMNSPLRDTVVPENMRYIQWDEGATHPKTLGVADLDELERSRALFARKFNEDDPALDVLERRIGLA